MPAYAVCAVRISKEIHCIPADRRAATSESLRTCRRIASRIRSCYVNTNYVVGGRFIFWKVEIIKGKVEEDDF